MPKINIAFVPGVSAQHALFSPKVHYPSNSPVPQFEARGALKLSTLIYEQVVFDWPSKEIDDACRYSGIERPENWVSADEYSSVTGITSFPQFLDKEKLDVPEEFYSVFNQLDTDLGNLVGDKSSVEMQNHFDQGMVFYSLAREAEASRLSTFQSLVNWSAFNVGVQSTLTCFTSFERKAAMRYFGIGSKASKDTISHSFALPFFDFDQISWESLKISSRDPRLRQFHEWVSSGLADRSIDVQQEISRGMFELLIKLGNPSTSARINLGLSCVPLPLPVNPVSIGLGIKDMVQGRKLNSQYGWLFAFMELVQSKATPAS